MFAAIARVQNATSFWESVTTTFTARIEFFAILEEVWTMTMMAMMVIEFAVAEMLKSVAEMFESVVMTVMMSMVKSVMTEWFEEWTGRAMIFAESDQWAWRMFATMCWKGDAFFAWPQMTMVVMARIRDAFELTAWTTTVAFVVVWHATQSVTA